MSGIPSNPNIIGSIFQSQASAGETAKTNDAQRNKRARDAKELARLTEQQESEVENTEQTDQARVHRQDERQRNGQDARDTLEAHDRNQPQKIYHPDGSSDQTESPEESKPQDHIDLGA